MISFKEHYLAERELPKEISFKQMQAFEKAVDKIFKPYGLDFKFTKHFRERMSDTRNDPLIKIEELADLIKKIYKKQGKPLSKYRDAEVVIKDMQSNLNMPVAIEWDKKNNELDIIAKTIMRKKNFTSPDKKITYESRELQ